MSHPIQSFFRNEGPFGISLFLVRVASQWLMALQSNVLILTSDTEFSERLFD